jgi:hypothetical protein
VKKKPADYRVRIVTGSEANHYRTYITRVDGRVSYFSADETPLALSSLVQKYAAELRFQLEDVQDAVDAAFCTRRVLNEIWKNNPACCPKVEVL